MPYFTMKFLIVIRRFKLPRLSKPPFQAVPTGCFAKGGVVASVGGSQKGWFPKGWFWQMFPGTKNETRVHSDVPRYQKPERGYIRMFPGTKNRNEATFVKPANYETALLFPLEIE